MKASSLQYYTYLLRLWAEEDRYTAAPAWRLTLEDSETGARFGFTSLAALVAHLESLMGDDGSLPRPGQAHPSASESGDPQ